MWHGDWRERVWSQLDQPWQLIVVGGGITGAGVLRLAVTQGLRALLVEARDFGWGTSSRSTKLVHGGLRYLAQRQYAVTRESVRERERLVREGPGLVERLGFLFPFYQGLSPSKGSVAVGLAAYDLLARRWCHRYVDRQELLFLAPHIDQRGLEGGFQYADALADDARLVLRVIREAVRAGAAAINYVSAERLLAGRDGTVHGLVLRDGLSGRTMEVRCQAVVNATGAYSDALRAQVQGAPRVRPSRGSHIVLPSWQLPAAQAIDVVHPRDGRLVFVLPWQGATLAGTTDIDHVDPLEQEPRMSSGELEYLVEALRTRFPSRDLDPKDFISTFAGLRPIIGTEKSDPSQESRAHVVLAEHGLITVSGGKLTTFRVMASDALSAVRRLVPGLAEVGRGARVLDEVTDLELPSTINAAQGRRLMGRHGVDTLPLIGVAQNGELEHVADTPYLWAELRWACRDEGVLHLEDLLLRRLRIGLLLANGGAEIMERVRMIVQSELAWDDARWAAEAAAYADTWERSYRVPL